MLWTLALLVATPVDVDFDTQVVPVLTKAGCNTGACHGSASGRGGFKLSLYGSNPAADHYAIVHQLEGRRVNLADPESSLIVRKPTGDLDHGGGFLLDADGAGARRLVDWIRSGAGRQTDRWLTGLQITPRLERLGAIPARVPLRATARFSDGTQADVTPWTVFTPLDSDAVKVDVATGEATVNRRGWHVVTARFLDRVEAIEFLAAYGGKPSANRVPEEDFIDHWVNDRLDQLGLIPSPAADDATFCRRVYLDLWGQLPLPDSVQAFVEDARPDKRERLIDELLSAPQFVDYWTYHLAQWLRLHPAGGGKNRDLTAATTYYEWLRRQIADQRSVADMARDLLLASGNSQVVGPASFYRTTNGPREQAELFSEVFMGARLRCANCHNHPLDHWTQDDYHGLAAVFAKVEPGQVVRLNPRGEVTHPATGRPAVPRIPGTRFLVGVKDPREALAEWLTAPDNPYFARAFVNRVWRVMMGRGLVEPPDDQRVTNPPTHPELLDALAHDFVGAHFDLRHVIRRIALSAAYQRSAVPQESDPGDDRFYSHALVRPLPAEVLADAISDVTGVWDRYGDLPPGTRAIRLIDPQLPSASLDLLGRCDRQDTCEGTSSRAGGLARALHVFNGPLLNDKIAASQGRLAQLVALGRSDEQIVGDLYARCLAREPSAEEHDFWRGPSRVAQDPVERGAWLEDLMWGLLSSREFTTNH